MASCVELNGTVVTKVGQKCRSKDILTYRDAVRGVEWVKAEDIPLEFLYEDKHLMVINKPAGMVCHPSGSLRSGTLLNALLHHMGTGPIDPSIVEESFPKDVDAPEPEELLETSASSPPIPFPGYDGTEKPGIVHRLDKGTTGVMVVAKNEACHAALMKQFTERSTGRVYHAMVLGVPEEPEGELTTRIGPAREQSCMAVVGEEREGRVAITGYRVLESLHGGSLVEFRLKTGRTHQIRVHASHLGHPLIGDATYSTQAQTEACPQGVCLARPALHATSLAFNHPHSNERMLFEAPTSSRHGRSGRHNAHRARAQLNIARGAAVTERARASAHHTPGQGFDHFSDGSYLPTAL